MKRILLVALVILSCAGAFAQTDIPVKGRGPYYGIVQGVAWGKVGVGGIENAYLIFPTKTDSNLCVSVRNNNPSNAHAFSVGAYIAHTPNIAGYYADNQAPALWDQTSIISGNGTGLLSVGPNSQATFLVPSLAASEVAITVSGTSQQGGSPDSADIYAVSTDAQSCSIDNGAYPVSIGVTAVGSGVIATAIQSPRTLGEIPITASPVQFSDLNDNIVGAQKKFVQLEPNAAVFYACTVYLEVTALGGTSPSLSVYLDSTVPAAGDGTHFFDIAAFQNPYTSTGNSVATIIAQYGGGVRTPVQQTLSASTVLNGPIYGNLEVGYVLTGTNPTATASIYGVCQ